MAFVAKSRSRYFAERVKVWILIGIISVGSFWPTKSRALAVVDAERMSYDFVRGTCHSPSRAFADIYSPATITNFEATGRMYFFDFDGVKGMVGRRGLSSKTKFILESASLHRALQECFGDSIWLKRAYVLNLITAEVAALYAGMVGGVGAPVKVFAWGFQLIRFLGWDAVMASLVQRGIIEESTATAISFAAGGAVVVGVTTPVVIQLNDERLANNRQMRAEFEAEFTDFKDFVSQRATLTDSPIDRAYAVELNHEISVLGRKLASSPAATAAESREIRAKMSGSR